MRQTTSTIPFAKPKITESADESSLLDERRVHHDADSFLSWEKGGDEAVCHHVSESNSQVLSADSRLPANGEGDVAQNSVATPNLGGASFLTSFYAAPALDASNSTHSTASSLLQTPNITRRLLSPTVVDTPTFPTIVFETEVDPLIGSSTSHSESREGHWKSSIREQDAGGSSGLAVFGTGNGETSDESGSSIYLSVYEEEDRPSSLSLPECGAKVSRMWETLRHGGCFYVYTEKPLPLLDFARCPRCRDMNLVGSFMRSFERKPLLPILQPQSRSKRRRGYAPYRMDPPSMAVKRRRTTVEPDDHCYLDMDPSQGVVVNVLRVCVLCTTKDCEFVCMKPVKDAYILPFVAADYCEFFETSVVVDPELKLDALFGTSFDDSDST